jgi:hypothetical protein
MEKIVKIVMAVIAVLTIVWGLLRLEISSFRAGSLCLAM